MNDGDLLACPDESCQRRHPEPDIRIKSYLFGRVFRALCHNCWKTWERQSDGRWIYIVDW